MLLSCFFQLCDSNGPSVLIQQTDNPLLSGSTQLYEQSNTSGLHCVTFTIGADSNDNYRKMEKIINMVTREIKKLETLSFNQFT